MTQPEFMKLGGKEHRQNKNTLYYRGDHVLSTKKSLAEDAPSEMLFFSLLLYHYYLDNGDKGDFEVKPPWGSSSLGTIYSKALDFVHQSGSSNY